MAWLTYLKSPEAYNEDDEWKYEYRYAQDESSNGENQVVQIISWEALQVPIVRIHLANNKFQ